MEVSTQCYCVPFRIENRVRLLEVLVVPCLPVLLFLGTDFRQRMGIVPNIRSRHWINTAEPDVEASSMVNYAQLPPSQSARLSDVIDSVFVNMSQGSGWVGGV